MIVERIRKRKDYDSELFLKAVKTFLKGKDKDMDFLFPYAKKRKIEEKAYPQCWRPWIMKIHRDSLSSRATLDLC